MNSSFLTLHKLIVLLLGFTFIGCNSLKVEESVVGLGWSNNSVNTVVFRNSAVVSTNEYQFTAYYNPEGYLILAKRRLNSNTWKIKKTAYKGNVKDAHNTISIAMDADGFLHVSWDQHNTKLRYARSKFPLELELTEELSMTGLQEDKVTYPEFHNLPNGKLLFCYRSGESGRGNMVINSYDVQTNKWTQLQNNLLDGEEKRSAYWQTAIDSLGNIHLSWVWRETWDVSSNHDMCYAISRDGGITWEQSNGKKYELPITQETAEIAWEIPQKSSLINQTSMVVDKEGVPYIATYWNNDKSPQYKVVYLKDKQWKLLNTDFRKSSFYLGGGGTKRIPISRPKIIIDSERIHLLFRDEERGNKILLASTLKNSIQWNLKEISKESVGQWEPNYDVDLWEKEKVLHIFSQKVTQLDGEGVSKTEPQPIKIIQIKNIAD
ncbi:MAG: BNR repeat-containing protein [Galbibacter orientalis]|uniref:BNR repeat-containing protein n=1 Tax=Galbibacter orientalis TaxID=453852 RepID=UPI0030016293